MLYLIRHCSGGGELSQDNLLNKFFPNNVVNGRCTSIFFGNVANQTRCAGGVLISSETCQNITVNVHNRQGIVTFECSPFTP
ncbi:MAG: hypothetical protein FWG68_04395 [Defluviitaleaceae bacterium]|nr:hypothetical protein [Defluviitaleaceae bacterium]